ncbi:MAG: hypothetical protein ACYC26_08580 [Phycisphaerales bacterium]
MASAVQAGTTVIDDFTGDTLDAKWVSSAVFKKKYAATPHSFDTTSVAGQLTIKKPKHDGTRMDAVLRSDVGLGVGQTLWTDTTSLPTVIDMSGMMIATGTGITDRKNIILVGWAPGSMVIRTRYFDHAGTLKDVNSAVFKTAPTGYQLFIERAGENQYTVGYDLGAGGGRVVLTTWTISGSGNLNPGAAIGYFADLRGEGAATRFDNLRLEGAAAAPKADPPVSPPGANK